MYCFEDHIVERAKSRLDIPWRHLGRNEMGIDCAGLVILVGREVGAVAPDFDTQSYGRRPQPREFFRQLDESLDRILIGDAGHGCVAVFNEPRFPCHVGVLELDAEGLWVIHAHMLRKRVVRERVVGDRLACMTTAYRYRRPGV